MRCFLILYLLFCQVAPFQSDLKANSSIRQKGNEIDKSLFPGIMREAIDLIEYDPLGNESGEKRVVVIDEHTVHVTLRFTLKEEVHQDDWQVNITPSFSPSFHWAPHLTPTGNHVIDQHVFRTPALIISDGKKQLTIIPDVEMLKDGFPVRWYMDLDAQGNRMTLGMGNNVVTDHVLFERSRDAIFPKGEVQFGFYLILSNDAESLANPFRKPLGFMWAKWGHNLYSAGHPVKENLEAYVKHTYHWAFDTWSESVWQEFPLHNTKVGAPVFIVNVTQSPNYPGVVNEREFRSVWNQAWFSSLRSASGLFRYGRRTKNEALIQKANLTKELALGAPKKEGFFYSVIGTEMEKIDSGGKIYNRSKGWNHSYWGNSNRNPYTWDPRESPFHILDMSWTALFMLRWYEELEKDDRLLQYAREYADALLKKQSADGFFPGWLDTETLQPMQHLNQSPETSVSVTFLLKLYEITHAEAYKISALKAMGAIVDEIIPIGRWEDFETYWSCSRYGFMDLPGKKVTRNNMYKQNNFSMFWTAEALYECYRITENKIYLQYGQRTLDEMLMTQASWQPPYMYVNVLGGFGVLNADGEWNDSRGSLFSSLILQYADLLDQKEYEERGIAALKSAFVMMYCPENPQTKAQWEKVWPFFGPEDYGFTMENYGHGGRTTSEGEGMGEFTIYDWGNGAASEAYNKITDQYGDSFLK